MGLRDLADEMFEAMVELKTTEALSKGFSELPMPDMTPVEAYEHVVLGTVDRVTLNEAANRTAATGIVPYPPGIPLLMPGENFGPDTGPFLAYLKALEAYDRRFPGFGHDTHGVEVEDGTYYMLCVQKNGQSTASGSGRPSDKTVHASDAMQRHSSQNDALRQDATGAAQPKTSGKHQS